MTSRSQKFEVFQKSILEQLIQTNIKLDKVCALLVSNQLLQECISPEGEIRSAQDCAEIVSESFCAGMCLNEELSDRSKEFDYQKSEFFISGEEDNEAEDSEDDDEDDDSTAARFPAMKF
jgi:hypothetical protein